MDMLGFDPSYHTVVRWIGAGRVWQQLACRVLYAQNHRILEATILRSPVDPRNQGRCPSHHLESNLLEEAGEEEPKRREAQQTRHPHRAQSSTALAGGGRTRATTGRGAGDGGDVHALDIRRNLEGGGEGQVHALHSRGQ